MRAAPSPDMGIVNGEWSGHPNLAFEEGQP